MDHTTLYIGDVPEWKNPEIILYLKMSIVTFQWDLLNGEWAIKRQFKHAN